MSRYEYEDRYEDQYEDHYEDDHHESGRYENDRDDHDEHDRYESDHSDDRYEYYSNTNVVTTTVPVTTTVAVTTYTTVAPATASVSTTATATTAVIPSASYYDDSHHAYESELDHGNDALEHSAIGQAVIDDVYSPSVVTTSAPVTAATTSWVEGYQFTITNGQVQSAVKIDDGYAREATIDWNTTWSVDGNNVLRTESHGRYVETSVYTDSNGDGLYTKVLEYYDTVSPGTTASITTATSASATVTATPTVPASLVTDSQEGLVTVYGDQGVADDVYRLYEAAFNRASDHDGLGYWVSKVQQGASLTQVAGEFVASQEFATRYGESLDDGSFVDALYSNVLGRTPDAEGHDYWTAKLAANQLTQAQVLESFANSAENVANVADDMAAGIQYSSFIV